MRGGETAHAAGPMVRRKDLGFYSDDMKSHHHHSGSHTENRIQGGNGEQDKIGIGSGMTVI